MLTEAVAIAKLPAIQVRGIFYLFTVIKICYDRIKVSLELNVIYYNLYYFHNSPDESRSAPVRQQLCWCTRTRHTILYHWLQLGVISRIFHSPHTIDCNRFRNNLKFLISIRLRSLAKRELYEQTRLQTFVDFLTQNKNCQYNCL